MSPGADEDDDLPGGLPALPPVGTAEETAELDPAEGLDLGESEGVGLDDAVGLADDFDAADFLDVVDGPAESMLDGEEAGDAVGSLGSAIDDSGGEYGWTEGTEAPDGEEWNDGPLIDAPEALSDDDDGALGLDDEGPLAFAGEDEPTDLPPLDRDDDVGVADDLDLGDVLELTSFSDPPPPGEGPSPSIPPIPSPPRAPTEADPSGRPRVAEFMAGRGFDDVDVAPGDACDDWMIVELEDRRELRALQHPGRAGLALPPGEWTLVLGRTPAVIASPEQVLEATPDGWQELAAAAGATAMARLAPDRYVVARPSARGTHDVLWMLPEGGGARVWLDLASALRDNGGVIRGRADATVQRMHFDGESLFVEVGAGILRVVVHVAS